ncbi:hypothetical protein HMPREF3213_01533 [Heyndrickxia coagulans]|uniref:Uncharacterized protein n=1 Tax=Heyndrickxia coagulans TaxID=1398 RepID=A0A133KTY7_HEYCO|nr:hypothetical protein HMPREF3213_01533 [Heyndrickxia coagulans]
MKGKKNFRPDVSACGRQPAGFSNTAQGRPLADGLVQSYFNSFLS